MSPASQLFASSKAQQFAHFSKPHKNEAFVRLRNSTLCLVTLVLLTYLLPIPSLWTALNVVRGEGDVNVFWAVCAAGMPTCRLHLDVTLTCFSSSFRDCAIRPACTQPRPGRSRNPISTNTTSTLTIITRQKPAHPPRSEKTANNLDSRRECTLFSMVTSTLTLASRGRIDRRVHKRNGPSLHRTSPRPNRRLLGRCTIPCLVLRPPLACPLGPRRAPPRRRLRLPLLHTTEDIPLHLVVRVSSTCDDRMDKVFSVVAGAFNGSTLSRLAGDSDDDS